MIVIHLIWLKLLFKNWLYVNIDFFFIIISKRQVYCLNKHLLKYVFYLPIAPALILDGHASGTTIVIPRNQRNKLQVTLNRTGRYLGPLLLYPEIKMRLATNNIKQDGQGSGTSVVIPRN
jgi:hypothetical protein